MPTTTIQPESDVLQALSHGGVRSTCGTCGFPLPSQPGKYPTKCPGCNEQIEKPGEPEDA